MSEEVKWPWWSIDGETLMVMLQRCYDGEKPFMVYAEAYANAVVEKPKPDEDD